MDRLSKDEALALFSGEDRLEQLKRWADGQWALRQNETGDVNNHIHTTYSFSPYTPTAAVWFAFEAGLETCGLMDHDSIAGAEEFLAAAETLGIAATVGLECRVKMTNTPYAQARLNNPDQAGIAYMTLHGVPHQNTKVLNDFFAPYRARRNDRNRAMVKRLNGLTEATLGAIDFDRDVLPLSMYERGGAVTERHIARALAERMIDVLGRGEKLIEYLGRLNAKPSAALAARIVEPGNPYAMYDLLGFIKSDVLSNFYIDADAECPDVREVLALGERIGAISAYPYLGDVTNSVTGDKRPQKFEDDLLDRLIPDMKALGFRAVTYMPSRNTRAQLERLRSLIAEHGLFEISGEDINSPRQPFVIEAQRDPMFASLYEATWALIAHERRASVEVEDGLFSEKSIGLWLELTERVERFSGFAKDEGGMMK